MVQRDLRFSGVCSSDFLFFVFRLCSGQLYVDDDDDQVLEIQGVLEVSLKV